MKRIQDIPILVFALSVVGLWLSVRIGGSIRKKQRNVEEEGGKDFDRIISAILTLLALIIGFTFSMAVNRYDQRKICEVAEANAIGTEYVRVGLLPAADATRVRLSLKNYLDQRVVFYLTRDEREAQQINAHTDQLQTDLSSAVYAAIAEQQTPALTLALSGMNDVLNSQGYTQAAWLDRLPSEAWILMAIIAICCNIMIGYGSRRAGAKGFLFLVMPLILSISFFLIAEIDSPRSGIIRVHPENLTSLSRSLQMH
jgi:FtsH-binding integral membrane protein